MPPRKIVFNSITLSVVSVSLTLFSTHVLAGAWVPAVGSGYAKLAYADYEATDFFGQNDNFGSFEGNNTSFYFEAGIAKELAIFTNFIHQDIRQTDANGVVQDASGLGDVEIGLRVPISEGKNVVSFAITTKLPFLYDEDDTLPLGNGQIDNELRILYGRSLHPYGYIGVEGAYRIRNGAPSDEYRYLLEYGYSPTKNLYLRAKLDGIESAGNGEASNAVGNLSVTPEFDLGKLEFTIGWTFDAIGNDKGRWGVELTYNQDLYGQNALDGDGLQFGLTRAY